MTDYGLLSGILIFSAVAGILYVLFGAPGTFR